LYVFGLKILSVIERHRPHRTTWKL